MSEPRQVTETSANVDGRLTLDWKPTPEGAILTVPIVENAAPAHVINGYTSPPALAIYIANLHNQRRAYRNSLGDATNAADKHLEQFGDHPVLNGREPIRNTFLVGYNRGYQQVLADDEEQVERLSSENASLRAQVEAAYKRAESMQAAITHWRGLAEARTVKLDEKTDGHRQALQEVAEARSSLRAAEDEVTGLTELVRQKDEEIARLIRERDSAAREAADRTSDVEHDEKALSDLNQAYVKLREEHAELVGAFEALRGEALTMAAYCAGKSGQPGSVHEQVRNAAQNVLDLDNAIEEPPALPNPGSHPVKQEELTLDPSEVLRDSTNALLWARQFWLRHHELGVPDEGTLQSWFAVAIENGRTVGQRDADDPVYDKTRSLRGKGHHSPSYAEGYKDGRNDTAMAFRDPLSERDQALYAAHLLLAESVAAREETRIPWQKAVRRWQDEYVAVFGSQEDQA